VAPTADRSANSERREGGHDERVHDGDCEVAEDDQQKQQLELQLATGGSRIAGRWRAHDVQTRSPVQ
jgi:hypothetical protein